ncbi:MAG: hypothetical protein NTZ59_02385 [Bacteroidetes bacterium]|nr:hypothetical protein [Bacteroidota bacterium]
MNLLNTIVGDNPKVTVTVELDNESIVRLCIGLVSVFIIALLVYGIIKKSI